MAGEPERRAERDDLPHRIGSASRDLAGVDAAEAPADDRDALPVLVEEGLHASTHTIDDALRGAEVPAEPPPMGEISAVAQEPPHGHRRAVSGGEAGQHEHRVAVALGCAP